MGLADWFSSFCSNIRVQDGGAISNRYRRSMRIDEARELAAARAAGLADLGRRVDLAERSVRRGEGDPELADALKRDAEGEWE